MKRAILLILFSSFLLISGCNNTTNDGSFTPPVTELIPTPSASQETTTPAHPITVVPPKEETSTTTATPVASEVNCFIAVHLEPGPNPSSTIYAEQRWPALVQLVAAADNEGHKLNLLFNPQWASFILEDDARLAELRTWEANGHEIGLHHHGAHMNNWDGYTDQLDFFNNPDFIGGIDEMMSLMKQLTSRGTIRVAAVPNADAPYDYPAGIFYDVDGGWNGLADLTSVPDIISWNDHEMVHITHARYGASTGDINVTLEEIGQAIDTIADNTVIGIVFHCFEYKDNPDVFNGLFAFLHAQGVITKTVPDILS